MIPAAEALRHGMAPILDLIEEGSEVVLCCDINGLDPSIVPNTIGRAPGGLSYHDAIDLIIGASTKGRLAAVNFVEILPEADIDGHQSVEDRAHGRHRPRF